MHHLLVSPRRLLWFAYEVEEQHLTFSPMRVCLIAIVSSCDQDETHNKDTLVYTLTTTRQADAASARLQCRIYQSHGHPRRRLRELDSVAGCTQRLPPATCANSNTYQRCQCLLQCELSTLLRSARWTDCLTCTSLPASQAELLGRTRTAGCTT